MEWKDENYLLATCFITKEEENNSNFKKLRDFLFSNNIDLSTTSHIEAPPNFQIAKTTIIAYGDGVTDIRIKDPDKIEAEFFNAAGLAPSKSIHLISNESSFMSRIFIDNTLLVIKLNQKTHPLEISSPHTFYELESNLHIYGEAIIKQIRNSGIREKATAPAVPSDAEIEKRVIKNRIEKPEFPVFPDGQIVLPGTKIIGGRGFYYDADGIILDISRKSETGNILEDWVIDCGFFAGDFDGWKEVKGLLGWVEIEAFAKPLIAPLLPSKELFALSKPFIRSVDDEILAYLAKNPNNLSLLTPDAFESLVCSIYKNNGFEVERVGNWNQGDGSVDIFAIKKDFSVGTFKVAIQCKHSKNTISPGVIRELNGVIDKNNANIGVVATTSSFSKKTFEEVENYYWRIRLEDKNKIIDNLKAIFKT